MQRFSTIGCDVILANVISTLYKLKLLLFHTHEHVKHKVKTAFAIYEYDQHYFFKNENHRKLSHKAYF